MAQVFLRPRPLAVFEQGDASVNYVYDPASTTVTVQSDSADTTTAVSKQFPHFAGVLAYDNEAAYTRAIQPLLDNMLHGATACCFAYGHTNSGKTHTIFGYGAERGMYQRAIEDLYTIHAKSHQDPLLVQLRFFEVYNGKVFDLLNNRNPGFVREDADGTIHVRSETSMGPEGQVLVQSLEARYETSPAALIDLVMTHARHRSEGTSELHQQSSRSHAILEMEIVTPALAQARQELVVAKSEVVPIGKARDDMYIAIQMQLYTQQPDGTYQLTSNEPRAEDTAALQELQAKFDAAEAKVAANEARVKEEMNAAVNVGGKLVFVDLAGAEYTGVGLQRNPREMREAKEINTSLLALKECIRAQAKGGYTPYRNSKLTMVLKEHLDATKAPTTVMIANVSSSATMLNKAMNTIKYAALVADAFQCTTK